MKESGNSNSFFFFLNKIIILIYKFSLGYINLEDLKLVVGCLMADDAQITTHNVEELFHTIDQKNKGKIVLKKKENYEILLIWEKIQMKILIINFYKE